MALSLTDDGTALTAAFDGTDLFGYVYRPGEAQLESPRPYFHPLRTLAGDLVSVYRPHDHIWHKGIALSLPHVGPHNFWGGVTWRDGRYVQVPNDGAMVHEGFDIAGTKDDAIGIDERLAWIPENASDPVIRERRRVAATAWPDAGAWCLAFETALTNVSNEEIVIGSPTTAGRPNAGYGGLFWRGPRSFTGGTVLTPDGPGGDETMGRRGPWLGFAGRHDGAGGASTLVFRDHPGNFPHPTQWFVRSTPYACVCPAPFFDTEYRLAAGAGLVLRYEVALADGERDTDGCAALADRAGTRDLLA